MNKNSNTPKEENSDVVAREQAIRREGRIQLVSYSGMLPPAQELIRYNQAHPEAAERIIATMERQEAHRQRIELFGLILTFLVIIATLGLGTVLLLKNKEVTGLILGLSGLVTALGAVVVKSRKRKRQPRQDKE
jgi:uncharacterized membrane protein